MDNDTYGTLLRAAMLRDLGITEPPYRLTIEFDVGGGAATLRDERKGVDAFPPRGLRKCLPIARPWR